MDAAADWLDHQRQRRAGDTPRPELIDCPNCGGQTNRPCPACQGLGRVPREDDHDGELPIDTVRCTEELLEFWALAQWAKLGPAMRLWGLRRIDPAGLDALSRLNARLHEHEAQRHREQIERLNRTRPPTSPRPPQR